MALPEQRGDTRQRAPIGAVKGEGDEAFRVVARGEPAGELRERDDIQPLLHNQRHHLVEERRIGFGNQAGGGERFDLWASPLGHEDCAASHSEARHHARRVPVMSVQIGAERPPRQFAYQYCAPQPSGSATEAAGYVPAAKLS